MNEHTPSTTHPHHQTYTTLVPKQVAQTGRYARSFFNKKGELKHISKVKKIQTLLRVGARTRKLAVCDVGSAIKYGSGVNGASNSQINKRRAIIHKCVVRRTAGRSATLDFCLAKGDPLTLDPAYFLSCAPIRDLASAKSLMNNLM